MPNDVKKAGQKQARTANRLQYAPKPAAPTPKPVKEGPEAVALKKLTVKLMDDLKNPTAIPSVLIMEALKQARSI